MPHHHHCYVILILRYNSFVNTYDVTATLNAATVEVLTSVLVGSTLACSDDTPDTWPSIAREEEAAEEREAEEVAAVDEAEI